MPEFPSYVVLQSWHGLGIAVIDPFFRASPEKVVGCVEIRGVGWPREVNASRKESTTKRSVWIIKWCTILLVVNCIPIHSSFPSQSMNKLGQPEYILTVSKTSCERQRIGNYSNGSRKFWLLLAYATFPVSRNLAIKFSVVFLSGTSFLPKYILYCLCVKSTNFVTK